MKAPSLRFVVWLVFAVVSPLIAADLAFRFTDPAGLSSLLELNSLMNTMVNDRERGYVLPPGDYTFRDWHMRILPDHTRYTPDSSPASCRVVFLGDSLTFGHGVNDDETWVDLVARGLQVKAVNASQIAYNSYNVLRTWRALQDERSVFVYLAVGNDPGETKIIQRTEAPDSYTFNEYAGLVVYFRLTTAQRSEERFYWRRFWNDVAALDAGGVHFVAFQRNFVEHGYEGFGANLQAAYPQTRLIDIYTESLSAADHHPNRAGHIEIAESILPLIADLC